MFYLICSSGLLICLLLYDYYKKRRLYKITSNIPGPRIFPIIGTPVFGKSVDDVVDTGLEFVKIYGNTFKVWVLHYLVVVVTDPKHLKIIANSPNCLEKGTNYRLLQDLVGNGLITSPVSIWKSHRKMIHPTFNKKILDSFVEIFTKHGQILVKTLEENVDNKKMFDVEHYLGKCTLNIVWETMMGIQIDEKSSSKYIDMGAKLMQLTAERTLRIWLHPNIIFKLSQRGREFYKLLKEWESYIEDIIIKRQKEFKIDGHKEKQRMPFLDHLLSEENGFSLADLRDESAVNIIGGSDTVTSALSFIMVCLGMYKDVQEKVVIELQDVLGKENRTMTAEDLSKLTYLERVIKEVMRIYPPVVLVTRQVTKDLDFGDYILPASTLLVLGILVTNRDPKIWPNPMEFNPDRFLPEEVEKRDRYSYMTFSLGQRDCIGKQFAMMEMKVLVGTIVQSYVIDTDIVPENIRLRVNPGTKIIGGHNIRITRRL